MITRRNFLKVAALSSANLAIGGLNLNAATNAASYSRISGAGNKVNVACVGIGNRGEQIMNDFENTGLMNVVALCDIDMGAKHTQKMQAKYPKAKQFQDFRVMFDKMNNEIEAVLVATPDHSHFPICMMALANGKHVYVEKPMARTFYEAELMMQAAKKYPKVITQVGNQGHSEGNYFQFKAWMDAGIIKDVTAISAHMNNPRRWHTWDVNMRTTPKPDTIPSTLDWDNWLCSVPYHNYSKMYDNGEWRSWYDFGMGALGDWGAHIIDAPHRFLELGLPYEINPLKLEGYNEFFFPMASTILFKFGSRRDMPPVDITWYDGVNNLPPIPEGYGKSELAAGIPASGAGEIEALSLNPGKIIYSRDLTFKGGSHGSTLSIIPEEKAKTIKLPEVPKSSSNHYANFLLSCQGKEEPRSPFEVFGPLSQVFSLGVIAQRMNTPLYFDTNTKQITNNKFANAMLAGPAPRRGWEDFYIV